MKRRLRKTIAGGLCGILMGLSSVYGTGCEGVPNEDFKTNYVMTSDENRIKDSDRDGIPDDIELQYGLDPYDADQDDDGLIDGNVSSEDLNVNGIVDFGETSPVLYDTDGDGLSDGQEKGLGRPEWARSTDMNIFTPDLDPLTTTDPTNPDTDGDGLLDGEEDYNLNGKKDGTEEYDPLSIDTDKDGFTDYYNILVPKQNSKDKTPPIAKFTINPSSGNAPLTVNFDASESFDPESGIVEYNWDFDDDGIIDSALQNPTFTYDDLGIFYPTLIVTNGSGKFASSKLENMVSTIGFVDSDNDGYAFDVDCNDGDSLINPGATEVCDGIDNNCDGNIDEGSICTYRIPIIIANNEDETLLNIYTVELNVDTSNLITNGKMRSDCNDLTIMCEGNEVDRKVTGCDTIDTLVEFATTRDISAGTTDDTMCYVSYGDLTKTSPMDNDLGNNIYLLNDSLTSDLGGWFTNDHPGVSWNFQADGLHSSGYDGARPFTTKFIRSLPADDDLEIRVDTLHPSSGSFALGIQLRLNYTPGASTSSLKYISYAYDTNNNGLYDSFIPFETMWGVGADRDVLRYNRLTLIDNNLSFWYNITSQDNIDITQPPERSMSTTSGIGNYYFGFDRDPRASETIYKNLQIKRKYAVPPTISLGAEEKI